MCGRFEIHSAMEIIARLFGIDDVVFDYRPSYNVAPGRDIMIALNDGGNRLVPARWGFVPSWSKELKTGYTMINARRESVASNRSFRDSFERRRCLVIADGFFEWKKEGTARKPYYIHLKSGLPFGFAGLYNVWTSPHGEELTTCALITTGANELIAPIHDRMPVIEPAEHHAAWLDPLQRDPKALLPLLQSIPVDMMEMYPVTGKVNSFKHDDPENIKPI